LLSSVTETLYLGGHFERERKAPNRTDLQNPDGSPTATAANYETKYRHYLNTPEGIIGLIVVSQTDRSNLSASVIAALNTPDPGNQLPSSTKIWLKDHLGSLTAEIDPDGSNPQYFAYAPKQRNTREENALIKEGQTPAQWLEPEHKRKLAQKDVNARWTSKGLERHYGYKPRNGS
jgi:hypothetical protein